MLSERKLFNEAQCLKTLRTIKIMNTETINETVDEVGHKTKNLAERALGSIRAEQIKHRLVQAKDTFTQKATEACKATDRYAHENPWKAVGFAAILGLFIGLMARRSSS
jgi:ElaB/YqjD/DUF883 family membrane-anchored ribosome-binding protein